MIAARPSRDDLTVTDPTMRRTFALAAASFACLIAPVQAVTVSLDPANLVTNFISLGEWDTDGNFEGWSTTQVATPTVSGGSFNGNVQDGSNDPMPARQNFSGLGINLDSGNYDVIELRISRTAPTSRLDIFWGTTVANAFSGTRRVDATTVNPPADGAFHIIQFDMSDEVDWTATLDDIRLDPFSGTAPVGSNRSFRVDYIRVGTVIPEPSSVVMLGIGSLALLARRRR